MADSNFDIWRLQAQADIRGLIEAVRDGTPEIRIRAATALRALGATNAIPALQTLLVSAHDAALRKVLIATLDHLFQQEVDEDNEDEPGEQENRTVHLIAQLNSDSPEQVIRAAQNLADLKEKLATEALVVVFHNRQLRADVRLAAAEALIKLESAPVEVTLLAVLRHSDWRIRRNAAAVLGQLHADWAVHPIIAALRDEQEIVRRTAFAALKRIGTPDALAAIEPPTLVPPALVKPPVIPESPAVVQPVGVTIPVAAPRAPEAADPTPASSQSNAPEAATPDVGAQGLTPLPTAPPASIELAAKAPAPETATVSPLPAETTAALPPASVEPAAEAPAPVLPSVQAEAASDDVTRPHRPAAMPAPVLVENPLPFDDEDTQPTTPPDLPDDVS